MTDSYRSEMLKALTGELTVHERETFERALATGGGARSDLWLQLLSDVLELPLARTDSDQGAAYGAALLALQGVGLVERAAGAARTEIGARFEPRAGSGYREPIRRFKTRGV